MYPIPFTLFLVAVPKEQVSLLYLPPLPNLDILIRRQPLPPVRIPRIRRRRKGLFTAAMALLSGIVVGLVPESDDALGEVVDWRETCYGDAEESFDGGPFYDGDVGPWFVG